MIPKLISIIFALCLFGALCVFMFWENSLPSEVVDKTIKHSPQPVLNESNTEELRIRRALENALHIQPDETLPRGVKKLENVSIHRGDETELLIRWAVNDWMRWAGSSKVASLESGAKNDLDAMLGALVSTGVKFNKVRFEGTLPIRAETGDVKEELVIKAVFIYEAIKEYRAKQPRVLVDLDEIKKEEKKRKVKTANEEDPLDIAEDKWMHPELRREYR